MTFTISFSCKDSSILTSSIIDVERGFNSSLNEIISLVPITHFHFITRMLSMSKVIIEKTIMLYCGWSINGGHILSANSNLQAFFD